jgi:Protein of unknown function (DUF3105)
LAKKPRTPDPPRKVQAPKVRQKQEQGGGVAMPGGNVLIAVGLVGVVALAVALIVVLTGSGGGGADVTPAAALKVRVAMTAAGCTFVARPADAAQQHMSSPNQHVTYETFPPSSGIHNPSPAIWGNYRLPVDPRQAVHNLEHGGIVIWYGPGIAAKDRDALDRFYDEDENGVIISPLRDPFPGVSYPKHQSLGSKIALTVWTAPESGTERGTVYIATCPSFDEKAFAAFRDTFRGKGPERFPVSQMLPGGN